MYNFNKKGLKKFFDFNDIRFHMIENNKIFVLDKNAHMFILNNSCNIDKAKEINPVIISKNDFKDVALDRMHVIIDRNCKNGIDLYQLLVNDNECFYIQREYIDSLFNSTDFNNGSLTFESNGIITRVCYIYETVAYICNYRFGG